MKRYMQLQEYIHDHLRRYETVHILKQRRVGVTTALIDYVYNVSDTRKDSTILYVGHNVSAIEDYATRFENEDKLYIYERKDKWHFYHRYNNSHVIFTPVSQYHAVRGSTLSLVVLDEVQVMPDLDVCDFYTVIAPMCFDAQIVTTESLSLSKALFLRSKLIFNSIVIL